MARWRIGSVILCAFFGCCISGAFGQEAIRVKVGFLRTTEQRLTISLIEQPASNDGLAGAELAIDDNNTTGRFLKQSFSLDDVKLKPGGRSGGGDQRAGRSGRVDGDRRPSCRSAAEGG